MKPMLIILYGFAGVGKTTLAKRLRDDLSFSLCIEEDEILTMIGQWLTNELTAREHVFSLMSAMIQTHLQAGHQVIVPFLLKDPRHAVQFETITTKVGAELLEVYLQVDKVEAVSYLFERGTWGELGSPPITEKNRPHIEAIYNEMDAAMNCRPNVRNIRYIRGNIEQTYQELKQMVNTFHADLLPKI